MLAVRRMQFGQCAVEHFLGQSLGERFKHGIKGLALREELAGTCDFQGTPGVGLAVQGQDQGHRSALIQPMHKALDPGLDNGLGLRNRSLALLSGGPHRAGQVVDGVKR